MKETFVFEIELIRLYYEMDKSLLNQVPLMINCHLRTHLENMIQFLCNNNQKIISFAKIYCLKFENTFSTLMQSVSTVEYVTSFVTGFMSPKYWHLELNIDHHGNCNWTIIPIIIPKEIYILQSAHTFKYLIHSHIYLP